MPGAPNRSKKTSVCDSPSKMIDETPSATSVTSAAGPARFEQPAAERSARDASVLVDQSRTRPADRAVRNQTVNVSPCERHSSRPNWAIIASVSAV